MHNNSVHPSIDELGLDVQPATSTNYAIQKVLFLIIRFKLKDGFFRPYILYRRHHMTQNAFLIGQIQTTQPTLNLTVGHIP